MKQKLFLLTSKNVASRLTELFDFVWPTAAAIWNLRWQVSGLLSVNPDLSHLELQGRFVGGSGIRGANLRRACIERSWEDQQQEFARFLLFEFCSLYEAWCEGAMNELGQPNPQSLAKQLQFPSSTDAQGNPRGVSRVASVVNSVQSQHMISAFRPALLTNRKYSLAHLEELLICYRYFKEVRNSLIHAGGTTSQKLIDAEAAYALLTAAALGVKERPAHNPLVQGNPVALSLRGVVGFGDVVLKLVCTLDIEFSQSQGAEDAFLRRWRETHGNGTLMIAQDPHDRNTRIKRLVQRMNLPSPNTPATFSAWLGANRLIV